MWADGWVSPALRMAFTPQRAMHGIEIELKAPNQAVDQALTIDIDGQRWEYHVARGAHSTLALKLRRAAGTKVEVRIDAAAHFIPAKLGESADDRQLAWMLCDARLLH